MLRKRWLLTSFTWFLVALKCFRHPRLFPLYLTASPHSTQPSRCFGGQRCSRFAGLNFNRSCSVTSKSISFSFISFSTISFSSIKASLGFSKSVSFGSAFELENQWEISIIILWYIYLIFLWKRGRQRTFSKTATCFFRWSTERTTIRTCRRCRWSECPDNGDILNRPFPCTVPCKMCERLTSWSRRKEMYMQAIAATVPSWMTHMIFSYFYFFYFFLLLFVFVLKTPSLVLGGKPFQESCSGPAHHYSEFTLIDLTSLPQLRSMRRLYDGLWRARPSYVAVSHIEIFFDPEQQGMIRLYLPTLGIICFAVSDISFKLSCSQVYPRTHGVSLSTFM